MLLTLPAGILTLVPGGRAVRLNHSQSVVFTNKSKIEGPFVRASQNFVDRRSRHSE